jgi:hypothetical protein
MRLELWLKCDAFGVGDALAAVAPAAVPAVTATVTASVVIAPIVLPRFLAIVLPPRGSTNATTVGRRDEHSVTGR